MNKNFLTILGTIVILLIGYLFFSSRQVTSPTKETDMVNQDVIEENNNVAVNKTTTTETVESVVMYTTDGFVPKELKIKSGTTINFVNEKEGLMWVASNTHPVHTDLSGFDQLKGVGKGEQYSFAFAQKGSWGYHNHLAPADSGTIIVE